MQAKIAVHKASNDPTGTLHLTKVAELVGKCVSEVRSVHVELGEGVHGRADLVARCLVDDERLTILIENKILASENARQVQGYVDAELARVGSSGTLLAILLQLGDEPQDTCTCPWAIVWKRNDVVAWLGRASELCRKKNVSVPSMVADYLRLLTAWDVARSIRTSHFELIEAVQQLDPPPMEWSLLAAWLWSGDKAFFARVLATPTMQQVIIRHGLVSVTSGPVLGRNELLQLWKPSWILPPLGPGPEFDQHTL